MNRRELLQGALASLVARGSFEAGTFDAPEGNSREANPIAADRWLEIDLYWFRAKDVAESVKEFWDRYLPFYAGVQGYRGLIVNVGWTVACVMDWSGDLEQRIDLPKGTGQQKWVDQNGPLTGTTEEREKKWKQRFAQPLLIKRRGYDAWSYGSLKKVIAGLRQESARRGITDFKVGLLNYAWTNAYGETPAWIRRHPEAFTAMPGNPHGWTPGPYFDPANTLHTDPHPAAAWPNGIPEGTPVYTAYGRQWGCLSKALSFDAIMLRDSFGMPMPYEHWGPVDRVASSPEAIRRGTQAAAALVRETKRANPGALVMMYSNGATAIGDWRCNCFDLESIAREGYLDIWVDQTWAGDWNEVGVREETFWNAPLNGYTYQLTYMLMHAAILAATRVRHYALVECPDAWEAEDVLHTAPERLRWEIWAYAHAAVKTPEGLKFPAGTYIGQVNRGDHLLSTQDVGFLVSNINRAVGDAHGTVEVFGPTLVYSREAMQWQADHARPGHDIKEWTDEQAGGVIKWPVPILSATRVEWTPKVHSDLFVFQTPSHLAPREREWIVQWIKQGHAVAIWGSPAGGIDAELEALGGLSSNDADEVQALIRKAVVANGSPEFAANVPASFPTYHRMTKNRALNGVRVVYAVENSPALTLNTSGSKRVMMWDPPDVSGRGDPAGGGRGSLRDIWGGSAASYALAAGALNDLLASTPGALHAVNIGLNQTINITAWRTRDGQIHILAGNLEEGLRDDADMTRCVLLVVPESWKATRWTDVWTRETSDTHQQELEIELGQARSVLLVCR